MDNEHTARRPSAAPKDRLSLSWSQSLDVDYAAARAGHGGSQEAPVSTLHVLRRQ
jgi:hypothetical protein